MNNQTIEKLEIIKKEKQTKLSEYVKKQSVSKSDIDMNFVNDVLSEISSIDTEIQKQKEFKAFDIPKTIYHFSCCVRSGFGGSISTYNEKKTECDVISHEWQEQNRGGSLIACCTIKYKYHGKQKRKEILFHLNSDSGLYDIPNQYNPKVTK